MVTGTMTESRQTEIVALMVSGSTSNWGRGNATPVRQMTVSYAFVFKVKVPEKFPVESGRKFTKTGTVSPGNKNPFTVEPKTPEVSIISKLADTIPLTNKVSQPILVIIIESITDVNSIMVSKLIQESETTKMGAPVTFKVHGTCMEGFSGSLEFTVKEEVYCPTIKPDELNVTYTVSVSEGAAIPVNGLAIVTN